MYADSTRRQNKRVGNYVVMQRKTSWGMGRSMKMATFSAFWAFAHACPRGEGGMPRPLDPPVPIILLTYQSTGTRVSEARSHRDRKYTRSCRLKGDFCDRRQLIQYRLHRCVITTTSVCEPVAINLYLTWQ